MAFNYLRFTRAAFLVVAISFLVYNIYQAIITTMIITHFPLMIERLPEIIQSTNPSLQLALFLAQEVAGSTGAYVRLTGAIFALNFSILFLRNKPSYLNKLSKALLFESLYFLLYTPVVFNHFIGSTISASPYLNFNVGLSYLLQISLVSPPLLMLSLKLKNHSTSASTISWVPVAVSLYIFGAWIKHGFMWIYGVLPMLTEPTIIDAVGSLNSLLTLLSAAIISGISFFMTKANRGKNNLKICLVSLAAVLAGAYFVIYAVISIFSPIFGAYVLLTDFWMITLLALGIALFYDNANKTISNSHTLELSQG